jgi:hypothetical protein
MSWGKMRLIMKNSFIFALLLSYPLLTGCPRKVPTYGSPAEVANAMTRFSQAGRLDQAVQTGLEWIRTHPQDSIIYQQLGMTFVIKSSTELNHRRDLLNEASRYYERSITVTPGDPVAALLAASGIENVGRVASPEDRCQYFQKAKSTLVQLEPLIVGDHFQLRNGQIVSLATVRTAHDQLKSKLLVDMTQAQCE